MAIDKFDKIEEGLGKLLEGYEALKKENAGLTDALASKDLEIRGLHEKIKNLDREKNLVKEKIEILLAKVDSLIGNGA